MKKIVGIGSRLLLCFIGGVFLFFSIACGILYFVCSESNLIDHLDNVSFSEKMTAVVEDELTNLAIPSGLSEDFFDGKVSKEAIQKIAEECIHSNFAKEKFSPDLSAEKEQIKTAIYKYAEDNEKETDDEAVDSLASQVIDVYKKYSASSVFRYLSRYAPQIQKYAGLGCLVCFIIAAVIGGLTLWVASRKYLSFVLGTGGMMLIIAPSILRIMQAVEKVNITPYPVKHFLISFANGSLNICIIAGAILFLAAIALMIFPIQRVPKQVMMYTK